MPLGIDDLMVWGPLLGALGGGLMSKRDPLKGALLGAGLGAGGAALAGPGLLGAAATPAATGITGAGSLGVNPLLGAASGGMGLGSGISASMPSLASPSMLVAGSGTPAEILAANQSLLDQTMGMAKPIGNIASSANSVKGLLSTPDAQMPPLQPLPVATGQGGAQSLAQLVTSNANEGNRLAMDAEQRAKRRRQLIGG